MAIKDSDKVLVDTSAWIDFFRKKEPCHGVVGNLMDDGRVCCIGLILGELLQGAKTEKELNVLDDFLYAFEFLEESREMWKKAGELSFKLARLGFKPGLADCYIAVACVENNASLLTLDGHFGEIGRLADLRLIGT